MRKSEWGKERWEWEGGTHVLWLQCVWFVLRAKLDCRKCVGVHQLACQSEPVDKARAGCTTWGKDRQAEEKQAFMNLHGNEHILGGLCYDPQHYHTADHKIQPIKTKAAVAKKNYKTQSGPLAASLCIMYEPAATFSDMKPNKFSCNYTTSAPKLDLA